MSGDVQPRKRKDKKRKREEDDTIHHGVHSTKMGTDDVHLHVQSDHGTGGHWCAKIFFFSLFAILIGLIGLIIMENRGLTDLDTPLSESRFSEYFEGWVDENRESHDHDPHDIVAHEIEEHDEHDEPFEEEEDVSQPDDGDDHDDEHDEGHDDDHDDGHDDDDDDEHGDNDDDDEANTAEDEGTAEAADEDDEDDGNNDGDDDDDDNATQEENTTLEDNATQENDEDEDDQPSYTRVRREAVPSQEDDPEDDEDDQVNTVEEGTQEVNEDEDDEEIDDEDDEDEEEDENRPFDESSKIKTRLNKSNKTDNKISTNVPTTNKNITNTINDQENITTNDEKSFNKEDDDDKYEQVVDNDAEELKLLQKKAKQAQKESGQEPEDDDEPKSSPQIKPRPSGGPQAFETEDEYIEDQMRRAHEQMLRNNYEAALKIYEPLTLKYPDNTGALLAKAETYDKLAEKMRSNDILKKAINSYKRYLAFGNDILDDEEYRRVAEHCIEKLRFLGLNSQAVHIHEALIERFPNEPKLQNDLAVTYLLVNQLQEAKSVLNNLLKRWPNNGFAKVHYGFIIKNLDNDLENGIQYLLDGINSNEDGTQDGRFYFHLGDSLQRLNRTEEARKIYKRGARKKLYPSEFQRSLYNENNLRTKPFWLKKDFPKDYQQFFAMLEQNWRQIREEGINALNEKNFFINETENLKDKGDWKQLDLYTQGRKIVRNCEKARVTCAMIDTFPSAKYCRRGQTKFSVMHPNTHVWPHCGPTNCRLRAHLGLKIPSGTKIRVANEERTWKEGKFLIFDDSFEHEVWHNGNSVRLVLIVDVWHPDLTETQRRSLSPI